MIKNPAHLYLTSYDGRKFVRFQGSRVRIFVEVIEFADAPALMAHENDLAAWHQRHNIPFITFKATFQGKHLLFALVDIVVKNKDITPENIHQQHQRIKRTAQWYMYAFLTPIQKGEVPNLYPQR